MSTTFTEKIVANTATDKEIRSQVIVGAVRELTRRVALPSTDKRRLTADKARTIEQAYDALDGVARQWSGTRWAPVSAWIAKHAADRESLAKAIQRAFAQSRKRTAKTGKTEKKSA